MSAAPLFASSRGATWLRVASAALLIAVAAALMSGRIDMTAVHDHAQRLPAGVALGLLLVLPLLGFPASVLHVAAGIRFGAAVGLALVAVSIGFQLVVSYFVVRRWKGRFFARRFTRLRRRIPPGAHASIAVFAVLLPGAPYTAINYVLPLVGVPLRILLTCCWPLHALRSTVTVVFGDQSDQLTPTRLMVLAAYAVLLALGSWWLYRRLRQRLGDQPAAADDRMQPA